MGEFEAFMADYAQVIVIGSVFLFVVLRGVLTGNKGAIILGFFLMAFAISAKYPIFLQELITDLMVFFGYILLGIGTLIFLLLFIVLSRKGHKNV